MREKESMPRIFDNIEERLLPALQETMTIVERASRLIGTTPEFDILA